MGIFAVTGRACRQQPRYRARAIARRRPAGNNFPALACVGMQIAPKSAFRPCAAAQKRDKERKTQNGGPPPRAGREADYAPVCPKHKLGNALAASDTSRLRRRIEQHDKNFSRIIGIDDADALRDDTTVARAEPAAGIQETGHARLFGLDTQTGRHGQPLSGSQLAAVFGKAGAHIGADGSGGRRTQAVAIKGAGPVADEFHTHGHDKGTKSGILKRHPPSVAQESPGGKRPDLPSGGILSTLRKKEFARE